MALVESEQLNPNEVDPGYHPPTRVYAGNSQLYRDMLHSTEALFDWPDTRNETISGTHPNKIANTAVPNYSWEDNASTRYADPGQMSFEQCFMTEHVNWREPEFKQSPTSLSLFSSDNDVLRPDGANLEIWIETPRTWSLDPSLETLGEPATDEAEPLEEEYQVTFCTTKDICTPISRTPSIPSRKESTPSSPVSGTQSGKSRSKMPKCRRDSCSSSSSTRKRKPKEQARKAHAKVERRYRENLNSKIIELQQCLDRSKRNYPGYDMEFDSTVNERLGQNITRARKALRKADILTEVIRYINETDVEMRHISDELGELRSRYERLEAKCQNITGTLYT